MTIAEQMILGRRRLGWTQENLANAMGVHRSTVARWEQGEYEPKPRRLEQLRQHLGLDFTPKTRRSNAGKR
jgi:transcriptional regulator with XRE-family HTH domain